MKKEREEKVNKSEATIVTKESICTVCATFCFLAFLMLCTGSLIFGDGGRWVQAFLLGIFGYFAYPAVLVGIYLGVTGLLGKKLVKNRKLGWRIALCLVFAALIVHSAVTYSWSQKGYIARCFRSGEDFPKTAPCGVLGGLVAFAFSTVFSKIGGLVAFSVITLALGYSSFLLIRKPVAKTQVGDNTTDEMISVNTIPVATLVEEADKEKKQPVQPLMTPTITQRPGVSLGEESVQQQGQVPAQGFSPFGVPDGGAQVGEQAAYSHEMLFGGSPAENFRTNLLFDPNSRVNQPRSATPVTQIAAPSAESAYTPSYTDAFENSIDAADKNARPAFIVNDRTEEKYEQSATQYTQVESPVVPVQPVQTAEEYERPAPVVEETYSRREETEKSSVLDKEESRVVREAPVQSAVDTTEKQEEYKRHEYMNLFSPENPNVFGNDEETARFGREFADKALDSNRSVREERVDREEREDVRGGRDGLNLLDDEEEDDPYTLRSNFNVERVERAERGERSVAEGRDRDAELFARNDDLGVEERRSRGVEEENIQIEQPKAAPVQSAPVVENKPVEQPKPRIIRPYVRPRLDDFDCRDIEPTANNEEVEATKENIIATLEEFKITGASIASVSFGPTVTRYNVTIPRNISPKKVVALESPIGISLHANGVNIYPNYEDGVVSIEVPNKERQFVQLGCMLSGDTFVNAKPGSLMFAMGKDVANRKVYGDISKMIHMLVAGSSGSGKSVFLGALITSLIYKYSPEELRLILIDPKKSEFVLYNNLPHLMINEIITEPTKAVQSLNWAIGEMNRRYSLFEAMSRSGNYVVNLDDYNAKLDKAQRLPKIVIIIDELADLMLAAKKEMEDRIQNITQKARAAGIHMIVATQRPSTDVVTGVIKSNLATRIAFFVASDVDSRVILDQTGAQKLLGKGDLLYTMHGVSVPVRVQSAFISPEESQRIVNFIKNNNEAYYDEEATAFINSRGGNGGDPMDGSADTVIDPMYIEALRYVIQTNSASISMIQRKCSAGYNRAGKIIEWMEAMGYISPFDGAKTRKVLLTKEEFEIKYGPL